MYTIENHKINLFKYILTLYHELRNSNPFIYENIYLDNELQISVKHEMMSVLINRQFKNQSLRFDMDSGNINFLFESNPNVAIFGLKKYCNELFIKLDRYNNPVCITDFYYDFQSHKFVVDFTEFYTQPKDLIWY